MGRKISRNECNEYGLDATDDGMEWWIGTVECPICGSSHDAAIEIPGDQDDPIVPLECKACGAMACIPC